MMLLMTLQTVRYPEHAGACCIKDQPEHNEARSILWERFMKYADGLDSLSGVKYHPSSINQWCKVNAQKMHHEKINGRKLVNSFTRTTPTRER